MQIGITGGTGFIGSKLAQKHLDRGDSVRILSRRPDIENKVAPGLKIFQGDLAKQDYLPSLCQFADKLDVLYHCAGELTDKTRMYKTHVKGTENLLRAADGKIGHWVQLSSVGVYGPQRTGEITENTQVNPIGDYETTKEISDNLVVKNAHESGFSYTILRPSNIYGPGMPNQSLSQLVRAIDKRWFLFIGKPGASANYIHVDNVVEALLLCSTSSRATNSIYNLSDQCSIEDFVGVICNVLEMRLPIKRMPRSFMLFVSYLLSWYPYLPLSPARVKALSLRSCYPTKKIETELGYRHKISILEGIKQFAQYYRESKNQ